MSNREIEQQLRDVERRVAFALEAAEYGLPWDSSKGFTPKDGTKLHAILVIIDCALRGEMDHALEAGVDDTPEPDKAEVADLSVRAVSPADEAT